MRHDSPASTGTRFDPRWIHFQASRRFWAKADHPAPGFFDKLMGHANCRSVVPYVRRELYDKLLALVESARGN
jgi:hypothetical protein